MLARSKDGTLIESLVRGKGPPLLLVHGTSSDATRWPDVFPLLDEHFTVYAMHRRGRGGSLDGAAPYAMAREGEDIEAVIAAIGEPVFLLAHSYGAMCALEALQALRASPSVRRVILYEPPVPIGVPVYPAKIADRIESLIANDDRDTAVATFFRDVFSVNERSLEQMRSFPSWAARLAAAHTLPREIRATDAWVFDAARVSDVEAPTCLFVGEKSVPIAHEMTQRLAAGLRKSEIVSLGGQQHIAMDTAPALFVRETLAFFERV